MLGLCLAYLRHMHPAKTLPPDESARASAHIINLFLQDPLTQTLLPKSNQTPTAPAKELNALQIRLTSLENTLANLAKATADVRKDIKSKPNPPAQLPNQGPPKTPGPTPAPSYATKAALPPRPSCVVDMSAYTWPDQKPTPSEICATINAALDRTNPTQVHASAARWTAKGNLVIWGGANTTAHQLTTTLPHFTETLQVTLSALADKAPISPPTVRHNVKWSKLRINAVPTGKTVTITDSLTRLGTRSILTLYEIAPDRTWGSTYVYTYLLLRSTDVLGSCTVHRASLIDGNASTAFWAFASYTELFSIDGKSSLPLYCTLYCTSTPHRSQMYIR